MSVYWPVFARCNWKTNALDRIPKRFANLELEVTRKTPSKGLDLNRLGLNVPFQNTIQGIHIVSREHLSGRLRVIPYVSLGERGNTRERAKLAIFARVLVFHSLLYLLVFYLGVPYCRKSNAWKTNQNAFFNRDQFSCVTIENNRWFVDTDCS